MLSACFWRIKMSFDFARVKMSNGWRVFLQANIINRCPCRIHPCTCVLRRIAWSRPRPLVHAAGCRPATRNLHAAARACVVRPSVSPARARAESTRVVDTISMIGQRVQVAGAARGPIEPRQPHVPADAWLRSRRKRRDLHCVQTVLLGRQQRIYDI